MRYQGGKSRIARQIAEQIGAGETFISLFCGACSVESKIAPYFKNIICNDNHKYLIAMLNAVKHGYNLPDKISKNEYDFIRKHMDYDPVLTGFVGFGCSYGGKWFGGYAKEIPGKNCCLYDKQSLIRKIQYLKNASFICNDYRDVEIPVGAIVYADPPYYGTASYGSEKFNTSEFWDYMRDISKTNKIFISEQNAPDDFVCIWESRVKRTLDRNNRFDVTEKLFIHNRYKKWEVENES